MKSKNKIIRIILALLFLILGMIGLVLPVIPQVPFLILSVIMIAAIYMALSKLLELSSQKYIFEFIRGFLKRKRTDDKAE